VYGGFLFLQSVYGQFSQLMETTAPAKKKGPHIGEAFN